jgi:hypothetical protein
MQKPRTRQDNVIAEDVQGECVVYDGSNKKAHHLNSSLSWVWKHCDGSRTMDELAAAMKQDLGFDDAHDVIASGLKQLSAANLLEPGSIDLSVIVAQNSGISRRAVIAGAAVTAPVISSILVPTPAEAKSKPDKVNPGKGPDGGGAPGQLKKGS